MVAFLSYFYSLEIKASKKRVENNFFCALFHDLPEALTRDIISPVKYSVSGLDDIISDYEIQKVEDEIMPLVPKNMQDEFRYLLGIYEDRKKDEFLNKINLDSIKIVNSLDKYNHDKYNVIDGIALKACDRLSAFVEATISISHGVKSSELLLGKKQILDKLKENGKIGEIDFYQLALEIDSYLNK